MLETTVNSTRVKLEDGEIFSFIQRSREKERRWFRLKGTINKSTGYRHVVINRKYIAVHRIMYKLHNPEWDITNSSSSNYIDHIDRNKLNNNIENLRVVTHQQNQWNRNCKGYYLRKDTQKYQAQIKVNSGIKYIGTFLVEEDAKNAYLEAKKKYHVFNNDSE